MPICIYCGQDKLEDQFTAEHVIPRKIGGNLSPTNPFLINNVCNRCNTVAGLYIDSEFIKSYFTQNNKAHFHLKYARISDEPVILPLSYMGIIDGLVFENKICEFWLGPCGDSIFHFHEEYPQEPNMSPIVGMAPSIALRDVGYDKGFAFIFGVPSNPIWHPTILYSFINNFPGSVYYLGNGPTPRGGAFSDIPENLKDLHNEMRSLIKNNLHVQMRIGEHYGDRLLAKIGLGLGSIYLNDSFLNSNDAKKLRDFMWEKDIEKRKLIPITGMPFMNDQIGQENITDFLSWPGGHFVYISFDGKSTRAFVSFYETQRAGILISSEPRHWKDNSRREHVFVITPSLQRYVGPLTLVHYIIHKQGIEINADLKNLEDEMAASTLPPRHLDSN